MKLPSFSRRAAFQWLVLALLPFSPALAQMDRLATDAGIWKPVNSRLEAVEEAGEPVLRWHLEAGQNAEISLLPDSPAYQHLRDRDRLELEFRIASGQVDSLDLYAKGHVGGPRRYKVHQWTLGILTTPPKVWHARELDLWRPNWFPWDQQDGGPAHFTLRALPVAPGTVVELRRVRLTRSQIIVKPYFEAPITWPIREDQPDGSVVYKLSIPVLNASGVPTEIRAALTSAHEHFKVTLEPEGLPAKNGETVTFTATATLPAKSAAPLLHAETIRIAFSTGDDPQNSVATFAMPVVRPLPANLRRSFLLSEAERTQIREKLAAGDEATRKMLDYDKLIAEADAFLKIRLDQIPGSYAHPTNKWPTTGKPPKRFEIGDRMPVVVHPETGELIAGTGVSNQTWKEYLGYSGRITEKIGLAYLATGDEKYAAKAVELMEAYAAQYLGLKWNSMFEPPWSNGPALLSSSRVAGNSTYGTNRLFNMHMRMLALMGDSPSLTPEARERIYTGFVLPYATELTKFPGGISNMTDISNHNLLVLGLVFDDANLVHWALNTDAGLLSRLKDIDADGFSSEGRPLNYHYAAMAEYLPAIAFLRNSGLETGDFKERLLAAIRMPYQRATLWGVVPSTGDCARGQRVANHGLADHLLALYPEETWLLDIGRDSTISARLLRAKTGRPADPQGYLKLLETTPRLFREAGLAILRTGDTPETQIMATLDYGRNPMHGHLDRNQITLSAFGRVFTHGVGSLYNAGGGGGIVKSDDPKLKSFVGPGSLSQNVIVVDSHDQRPAIGELLAWKPEQQGVSALVRGIAPGVNHTRSLVLQDGLVVVFDRIESEQTHTFDFVYHNFGTMKPGSGWKEAPVATPLAGTANYQNLIDLQRLSGTGPVHLEWDLTQEAPRPKKGETADTTPVGLALWQLPVSGAEHYTAVTGMNNPNTVKVPDTTPTLITRVPGVKTLTFVTVLEPYREKPTVTGIEGDAGRVTIRRGAKTVVVTPPAAK